MAAQAQALQLEWVRQRPNRWKTLGRIARRKYMGTASLAVIVVFLGVAVFAPALAPYDPIAISGNEVLLGPGALHPLGTDDLGRDLLSRILYGSRVSLTVGVVSVVFSTTVAIALGLSSAYFRGRYDLIVQRFVDALQAFPSLVLAMVLVASLGASLFNVILAIAITSIAIKTRIIRGTALSLMENQYVDAARVIGATNVHIMFRYILPNCWAPILVLASATLGTAIIREASLSFLGLGPGPPHPTWGSMISGSARSYISIAPWVAIYPGIAITVVVLAFNLLGDALRDVLDPRLRGSQ